MGLGLVIGGALLSGLGAAIKNRQANANAQRIVAARNQVLADTMAQNRPLAESSRTAFDDRVGGGFSPVDEAASGAFRNSLIARAAEGPESLPGFGAAPEGVKAELAGAMSRAIDAGRGEAERSAKIATPGDFFFDQGSRNTALARDLGINANFAGGNLALLPHLQDLAEVGATRPTGPLGDILMGVGSMLGSFGGSRGMTPTTPATTSPGFFQSVRNNFYGTP